MPDFRLSDSTIYNYVEDSSSYQRGTRYYNNNRVYSFKFDEDTLTIHAVVIGGAQYDVTVVFTKQGNISSSDCTCPAHNSFGKGCKHVVAVLKAAQTELSSYNRVTAQNQKAVGHIFDFFGSMFDETSKDTVNIDITFNLEMEYTRSVASLELRIGTQRLYIIKNLKDFVKALRNSQPIEFGKSFTFDPNFHGFSKEDLQVLELISDVSQNEDFINNSINTYSQSSSVFKGKRVYLSEPYVLKLFEILKRRPFNISIYGVEYRDVEIISMDLPLTFSLRQDTSGLILSLDIKDNIVKLSENGGYFYFNGSIYNPSKEQQKYFLPFYNGFERSLKKQLILSPLEKERFASEVLPFLQSIGNVSVEETLENSFHREELQTSVFFDRHETGISAKLEFHYGDEIINPFSVKYKNTEISDKIIIRDPLRERKLLSIFEKYEFRVEKDIVYLDDEEKIFEFMYHNLSQLREMAEVYYSDSFKGIRVKDYYAFTGGVRLDESSDMLEFSFHFENIDKAELENIFVSLRQKKKYYRLKDGSFIPLDMPELYSMRHLLEQLDLTDTDLNSELITIPKYRALYIDTLLRESNLHHIERNLAFKQMVQNICEPQDMEFQVPAELQSILRDYQKIGFKWLKTLSHYGLGGILADDMGLGKTLQVISFILSEKQKTAEPALVIAPTSLVYNWQDEVSKFVPQLKVLVVSGMQKERQEQLREISEADIVVTSYALIRKDIEMYSEFTFSYCFLDEAQHIKNPGSQNAKSVKQINAKGYFALTGTPIENTLTELWSIFDFILPGYMSSHSRFVKKFETPILKDKDSAALKDLSRHIRPFILRRLKKDVLKELPEKIESRVAAELTDEQKKIYLAYLQQAKGEISKELKANGFERSHIKILSLLTRLRQICCHPALFLEDYQGDSGKLSLLAEIIDEALESGHRILIFSQFTSMLSIIKKHLEEQQIEYFLLEGSTKSEERIEMVKAFNHGQRKIFLISLKAGGTGLNLTGADMVIHYDPWWNPAVEDQASDRAYRIGQLNVVQVMKLITHGTIEEKIYDLQQRKRSMIETVIQPGETLLTKLTEQEIMSLFDM